MQEITITYLGQCGFLLDFGGTKIVTDPYLSDYVDKTCSDGEVKWQRLYPPPASLQVLKPEGILISHSHEDHMDPWTLKPYLCENGECLTAAPAPECGRLESIGASRVIYAKAEESFFIGDVKITPLPCAHTQLHLDACGRFHELSYLIEQAGVRIFFGGDMSLYDGLEKRLKSANCNLLLLPVNGRDEGRTERGIIGNIDHVEAAKLSAKLDVPYIPMHHDLYAVNGCSPEEILAAARAQGAKAFLLKPMETLRLSSIGDIIEA